MLLSLRNIEKSYRTAGTLRKVLDGISFNLQEGEIASITGTSGCGKSTLLNIINGITKPENGTITMKGTKMKLSSDRFMSSVRTNRIGQIFQSFNLIYNRTVMSNILLAAELSNGNSSMKREEIIDLLEQLGIAQYHNTQTGLLSGGQRQRVAIARALVNRPELILADEPTANLDDSTSRDIFKILTSLAQQKIGILIVTHKNYMHKKSDRVMKLDNGKLIQK